jgi:hypothetical protein
LCFLKSRLYKRYKKNTNVDNFNNYKKISNNLKSLLRRAKQSYYANKVITYNNDPKKLWRTIYTIIGGSSDNDLPTTFNLGGTNSSNLPEITNAFNNYFATIGTSLAASTPPCNTTFNSYLRGPYQDTFVLYPTSHIEIINIVNDFDNKSSAGIDEIPVFLVKRSINFIAGPLAHICNLSFSTGKFPNQLKIAMICPIYKKGAKNDIVNYRPISILPTFSKIIEKLVNNRLVNFTVQRNILNNHQFGFRAGFSTSMALLEFCDKISESVDRKLFVIGIFIDLQKAFDTVNHKILLEKLSFYGVRGLALEWFKDYISNRIQCTKIKDKFSSMMSITCGVPQGSILGPLLFILFINDIKNCSNLLHFILFADDTNALYSSNNFSDLTFVVNAELQKLHLWFLSNKLSINEDKCCYMLFGNKIKDSECPNVQINNFNLKRVKATKFLGVHIDDKLNWNTHIWETSKTISRNLGILNKVKYSLPDDVLLNLYFTLIFPHLTYGIVSWGSASEHKLNYLFLRQKRALRIITHSNYIAHTDPIFRRLHLLKIYDIYKLQVLLFIYKSLHKMYLPSCISFYDYFSFTAVLKPHDTRSAPTNLSKSSARTNLRCTSLLYSGPRIWNSIRDDLKSLPTISMFKNEVKLWLLSFYS